jgi:hypothetical protein
MRDPAKEKPTGTFADSMKAAPGVVSGKGFKIAIFANGAPFGWVGRDSAGWGVHVDDEKSATIFVTYLHTDGKTYYQDTSSKSWLSVSDRSYLGFYGWLDARGFEVTEDKRFKSLYNGQHLSMESSSNAYLACWDAWKMLNVKFVYI